MCVCVFKYIAERIYISVFQQNTQPNKYPQIKMEFPHLGKHCSEKSCNKLGKFYQKIELFINFHFVRVLGIRINNYITSTTINN